MKIDEIEKLKNKKNRIVMDSGDVVFLYDSEIRKLGLEEGKEVDEVLFATIIDEYVYVRAKNKALAILERSMNSVFQLRTKLKRADYNDDIIDRVVRFLKEYKLVDDYNYGKMYVESNVGRKSRLQLKQELMKRGIDSEIISEILECYGDETEINAIKKYIRKYQDSDGNIPEEKKNKALMSLYRKGFSNSSIRQVIDYGE